MDFWFDLDRQAPRGLQNQLKDKISRAIIEGQIAPNTTMPASRRLAQQLGVSRNTVVLAYAALQDDGYLISRERSGFFVNPEIRENVVSIDYTPPPVNSDRNRGHDWREKLVLQASKERHIVKPANWRDFKYCFIYGQLDWKIFPVQHWRECWRDAVGVREINDWSQDMIDRDDPVLTAQIRDRLLPRRGLWVDEAQILVTTGAQNALYIALRLLLNTQKCFGIEEPGYPDARNIARMFTDKVVPLPVDKDGLIVGPHLAQCDIIFTTPSYQSPTTVTLSETRRRQLLQAAQDYDFLIIEDDYEAGTNYMGRPLPALKAMDANDRVIYISSLSKTLAPGLRLGYLVGADPFIREARVLRRLIMRHPASNNQRAAAYFLARGHHESLLRNLLRAKKRKRQILLDCLEKYLPAWQIAENHGGSSLWITGPKDLNARVLAQACEDIGVLIEPGNVHFMSDNRPRNHLRLGYASIFADDIEDGVKLIAQSAQKLNIAVNVD